MHVPEGKNDLFSSIKDYDTLEILLLKPERFPVAIDTGVKPRILRQAGRHGVKLEAEVTEVHRFPTMLEIKFGCYDRINDCWYNADLAVEYSIPYNPSLKLTAGPELSNFGKPAPVSEMQSAFEVLYHKLHPNNPPE